jgi:hypothetical protein
MCSVIPVVSADSNCTDIQASAPKPVYDHGDNGAAIDRRSGLMWMRCAFGQQWQANRCTGRAETLTWREVELEISRFNEQGGAMSYNDWRIPTVEELLSLVIPGCYEPALDIRTFPDTPVTAFWTSTTDPAYQPGMMLVHFVNGRVYMGNRSVAWPVRLVRWP